MVLKATPDDISSEGAEPGPASTAATGASEGLWQAQLQHALNVLRHTIMWRAIVNASLFGCASAWYFYFKPNVTEYFHKLGAR